MGVAEIRILTFGDERVHYKIRHNSAIFFRSKMYPNGKAIFHCGHAGTGKNKKTGNPGSLKFLDYLIAKEANTLPKSEPDNRCHATIKVQFSSKENGYNGKEVPVVLKLPEDHDHNHPLYCSKSWINRARWLMIETAQQDKYTPMMKIYKDCKDQIISEIGDDNEVVEEFKQNLFSYGFIKSNLRLARNGINNKIVKHAFMEMKKETDLEPTVIKSQIQNSRVIDAGDRSNMEQRVAVEASDKDNTGQVEHLNVDATKDEFSMFQNDQIKLDQDDIVSIQHEASDDGKEIEDTIASNDDLMDTELRIMEYTGRGQTQNFLYNIRHKSEFFIRHKVYPNGLALFICQHKTCPARLSVQYSCKESAFNAEIPCVIRLPKDSDHNHAALTCKSLIEKAKWMMMDAVLQNKDSRLPRVYEYCTEEILKEIGDDEKLKEEFKQKLPAMYCIRNQINRKKNRITVQTYLKMGSPAPKSKPQKPESKNKTSSCATCISKETNADSNMVDCGDDVINDPLMDTDTFESLADDDVLNNDIKVLFDEDSDKMPLHDFSSNDDIGITAGVSNNSKDNNDMIKQLLQEVSQNQKTITEWNKRIYQLENSNQVKLNMIQALLNSK